MGHSLQGHRRGAVAVGVIQTTGAQGGEDRRVGGNGGLFRVGGVSCGNLGCLRRIIMTIHCPPLRNFGENIYVT